MVRDALQLVNDFGVLCNASGKFKLVFAKTAVFDPDSDTVTLHQQRQCETSNRCVQHDGLFACLLSMPPLSQYAIILRTLEDSQSVCSSEISAGAASLLRRFQDPVTVMSLIMAQTIIEPLE